MARRKVSSRTMGYLGNPYKAQNMKVGYGYNDAQVAIFNRSQFLRSKATSESQLQRIGRASYNMHKAAKMGLANG